MKSAHWLHAHFIQMNIQISGHCLLSWNSLISRMIQPNQLINEEIETPKPPFLVQQVPFKCLS